MKPGAVAATNLTVNYAMKLFSFLVAMLAAPLALAQTAPAPRPDAAEPKVQEGAPLAPLAWLEGCWRGTAGPREFREHWMPLRGNMLIGMSHMVVNGKTDSYEYMRIESRADGVYYVVAPSGKNETAYLFTGQTVDRSSGRDDAIFTFTNPALEFPQRIVYRRASEGWLYAAVEGKVGGADRQVTYPMRRVDCESGELIRS
jgi:hypothetical protein